MIEFIMFYVVCLLTLGYLLFCYARMYRTIKKTEKNKKVYSRIYFETLVVRCIDVLKENVNIIAHPYFFSQSIDYILSACPNFIHVLILCKYILDFNAKNELKVILKDLYGPNYEESMELNALAKVSISNHGVQEYFHYVIGDIEKSIIMYIKNQEYVNKMIVHQRKIS